MNKTKILIDLENMVDARLFGPQPWLADWDTVFAVNRKLIQMGLVELVCAEPPTWRFSRLGKEQDVELFEAFMGIIHEWEVPIILEHYRLINESEADVIFARMDNADAESVLREYVKQAYFKYRNADKFDH